jgi:hypothetical protein
MNGERPCWPIAPARGHDVSAGIKELCETCWNSDPTRRPTAQAIVTALALEIRQDVATPQALQSSPIAPNYSSSTLREVLKKPVNFLYNATTAAGHRVNNESITSKLSNRFTDF